MANEIWVTGEMAHKNTPKFVNEGGVPGVSAGTVDQSAFNVRNKHLAREWLYNEIKRQKYREMHNITFDSDDGGEKERFAAARQEYFDAYGEDFMGRDLNTPWQDTYPVGASDKPVEISKDTDEFIDSDDDYEDEYDRLKSDYDKLKADYDNILEKVEALIAKYESGSV